MECETPRTESAQMDTTHLLSTSDRTTLVMPSTSLLKFDDTVKRETHLGNIVWPFWNSGRWHVAVHRPWGQTMVVDPRGKYDCKDLHMSPNVTHEIVT
jgi:hypothetical protein